MLDLGGLGADRVVQRQRPVQQPPVIWPRSAILHSAAASMVDGTLRIDRLHRAQDRHPDLGTPSACARSMAFWTMSTLSSRVGAMFTAASVMISAIRMTRHVHDEAVADPARRADAALTRNHRGHQFVGVQAALHQRLGPSRAHEFDRLGGRIVTVLGVHDLHAGDVETRALPPRLRIRSAGPTKIGSIRRSFAASIAPCSETSSHGCTTAVLIVGGSRQRNQALIFLMPSGRGFKHGSLPLSPAFGCFRSNRAFDASQAAASLLVRFRRRPKNTVQNIQRSLANWAIGSQ